MTGDEFEAAYLEYAPELWRFAARQLSSSDLAHDMVQDTFVYVWEKRNDLVIHKSIKAFLFTILRRRIIDHIRQSRSAPIVDTGLEFAAIPDPSATEGNTVDGFFQMLKNVPEQHRELLTLRWYHDLSYDEIAQVLGISVQAAQKQVSRSLAALKPVLKKFS